LFGRLALDLRKRGRGSLQRGFMVSEQAIFVAHGDGELQRQGPAASCGPVLST
jgi:hypothetical protein